MALEDIEIDNIERIERLLENKHGKLSSGLSRSIETLRIELKEYEFDEKLLDRINNVMYAASMSDDIKEIEDSIKHLVSTLWRQEIEFND